MPGGGGRGALESQEMQYVSVQSQRFICDTVDLGWCHFTHILHPESGHTNRPQRLQFPLRSYFITASLSKVMVSSQYILRAQRDITLASAIENKHTLIWVSRECKDHKKKLSSLFTLSIPLIFLIASLAIVFRCSVVFRQKLKSIRYSPFHAISILGRNKFFTLPVFQY